MNLLGNAVLATAKQPQPKNLDSDWSATGSALNGLNGQSGGPTVKVTPVTGAGAAGGNMVWMGGWEQHRIPMGKKQKLKKGQSHIEGANLPPIENSPRTRANLISKQDALVEPWKWNAKKWSSEMERASRAAGQPIVTREDFLKVWKTAVSWANQSSIAGKPITPFDAMDLMARETAAITKANGGAVTHTSVTRSVDNITDGTAWAVLNSAVQNAIGRAPTTAELHRFISKAKSIAASNPSVTKTTQSTDASGNTTASQTTTGGTTNDDYALAAQNMAATPEAAAYQVASTYMNALQTAISGGLEFDPVGVRG